MIAVYRAAGYDLRHRDAIVDWTTLVAGSTNLKIDAFYPFLKGVARFPPHFDDHIGRPEWGL